MLSRRGVLRSCVCLGGLAAASVLPFRNAAAADARLADGAGVFEARFGGEQRHWDIKVYYYRPAGLGADAPIVFVVHGLGRNADGYRDSWIEHAEAGRFIVVAPEFNRGNFPKSIHFNQGNVLSQGGAEVLPEEWSFAAVETVFDFVTAANGFAAERYDIYGHSAGSQFVHRMNWFLPDARIRIAVAANAGWYTFPDPDLPYPAGLKDRRLTPAYVAAGLARGMVVLLGTADNDPNHRALPKTPEAMAQGAHRFERGRNFFAAGKARAAALGVPFGWRMEFVDGVAHSNPKMAVAASRLVGRP